MKKILTVAVPAYNAEKYLRDNLESFCIDGILPYLDILVINDGSSDHTAAIAQEYVERYPDSYRMITKENGGHGSGINLGIREARGIYFKVVDADDWVERIAFCRLIETLRRARISYIQAFCGRTIMESRIRACIRQRRKSASHLRTLSIEKYTRSMISLISCT